MRDKVLRGTGLVVFVTAIAAIVAYGFALSHDMAVRAAANTPGPNATAANWTEATSVGRRIPGPEVPPERLRTATFGAGCFWGVEATFRQLKGVVATDVGYLGGTMKNPTYVDVCSGTTGHAEVVQVTYDTSATSYAKLLEVFWANHDPTTLNRQGPDVGTQYRSAIFYHSPEQRDAAYASKQKLQNSGRFRRPIVTEITPTSAFYRAEDYHQQYLEKRGLATCHVPVGG